MMSTVLRTNEGICSCSCFFQVSSPQGICFTRTGTIAIKSHRKRETNPAADRTLSEIVAA